MAGLDSRAAQHARRPGSRSWLPCVKNPRRANSSIIYAGFINDDLLEVDTRDHQITPPPPRNRRVPRYRNVHSIVVNEAGDAAITTDLEGHLIWLDLTAARKLLAEPPPPI